MPDPWAPGLVHDPGALSGYQRGRNRMEIVKVHATAKNGAGNVTVGKQGYFQFYLPKQGQGMQFAEADAVCWDSAEFNAYGPGIEFEREGTGHMIRDGLQEFEELTAAQLREGRALFAWLHTEWGVPLEFYTGPRYEATPHFRGFVNHGDLDASRTDGITTDEWAALTGTESREWHGMDVRVTVTGAGIMRVVDGVLYEGTVQGEPDREATMTPAQWNTFLPRVAAEVRPAGTVKIDADKLAQALAAAVPTTISGHLGH